MWQKRTFLLAVAGGCMLLTAPSQAQKQKKVETPKEQIQEERMQKLVTAYDLAAQGYQKKAPEYLITAAGLMRQLSSIKDLQEMKKLDVKVEVEGDKRTAAEKELVMPGLAQQSNDWFKDASDMGATAGVNVDKLIELAKKRAADEESKLPEEQRAVVGGPRAIARYSLPGQVDTFTVTLIKGYPTAFGFTSSSPLRLTVVHGTNPWVDAVGAAYQRTFAAALTNNTIVVRVQNTTKVRAQYQMFIN
jgi:hypothetical protein